MGETPGLLRFDIQKDDIRTYSEIRQAADATAIICIAQPNIDLCHTQFKDSYDINVTKTRKLTLDLEEMGHHVIFFSSDNVFDGEDGDYTEESQTNPINDYGKMKEETETWLLENTHACIFRIPKTVCTRRDRHNVFTETEIRSKEGLIRCIKGNVASYISRSDIYGACMEASKRKLGGLYQLCSEDTDGNSEKFSRKDLADIFCAMTGSDAKVEELDLSEFGLKERRPLRINMLNSKFKAATGYTFESVTSVMRDYIFENCE